LPLQIIKVGKDTDCSRFSSFDCHYNDGYEVEDHLKQEIDDLCTYLPNRAKYAFERGYGVSYAAYYKEYLAGFFSINTGHIFFDEEKCKQIADLKEFSKKPYHNFPAVKIVQLAVQSDYQGDQEIKIGNLLITAIQLLSNNIAETVGVRFLKVDALGDIRTLKFYKKMGFEPHYDHLKRYNEIMKMDYTGKYLSVAMYLDLKKTAQ
jgi:GNAT superfamily N-acetyltransferase